MKLWIATAIHNFKRMKIGHIVKIMINNLTIEDIYFQEQLFDVFIKSTVFAINAICTERVKVFEVRGPYSRTSYDVA